MHLTVSEISSLWNPQAEHGIALPHELWRHILAYCYPSTHAALARRSRAWNFEVTKVSGLLEKFVCVYFDPMPEHPGDEAALRMLYKLAQDPQRAKCVRVLGLDIISAYPRGYEAACIPCGSTTSVTRSDQCIGYRASPCLPEDVAIFGIDCNLWSVAARRPLLCRWMTVQNVVIAWANLCLAIKNCTNLVRVELPVLVPTRGIMQNRLLEILAGLPLLRIVQIQQTILDEFSYYSVGRTDFLPRAELVVFVDHMAARDQLRPPERLLILSDFIHNEAMSLHFLSSRGLSAVRSSCDAPHHLRIYPTVYTVTAKKDLATIGATGISSKLARYLRDVQLAFSGPVRITAVDVYLHPSTTRGYIQQVIAALEPHAEWIHTLWLSFRIPWYEYETQARSIIVEWNEITARELAECLRPLWALELLGIMEEETHRLLLEEQELKEAIWEETGTSVLVNFFPPRTQRDWFKFYS